MSRTGTAHKLPQKLGKSCDIAMQQVMMTGYCVTRTSVQRKGTGRMHRRAIVCLLAVLFLALPRLVPAAPFAALDSANEGAAPPQPSESPAANFAGSAFFYAEGAFLPRPDVETPASAHILPLEKVDAAPLVSFAGVTPLDRYRALNCLTNAIYYEAANEPDDGQRAVAQVVLNRVRHPLWPGSVCGVVYQGTERTDMRCQFTFSCDGSMARFPVADKWMRARRVAARALAGDVFAPVGMATYYHTLAVRPTWSSSLDPVAVVGAHIFYRMRGSNGTPQAFLMRYTGRETISGPSPRAYMKPMPNYVPPVSVPLDMGVSSAPYVPLNENPTAAWRPAPSPRPEKRDDRLPESTIRPEYRNTGRPLI
jgi:spore germination cell wall hydrolase CwlJ-like protein